MTLDFASLREWGDHFRWADVVDIGAVAVLGYLGLSWLRRHASRSFLATAIAVLLLYVGAKLFDLYLTSLLFQAGAIAVVIALLLIFQDDLRRAAERFALRRAGSQRGLRGPSTLDVVVSTVNELAEARIGALLVFPGREPLERHTRGGEQLDGALSRSLLVSLFHSASPGHDGAVVIEGERLSRFAVHLPLSRFPDRVGREGTRHSAALGLAESCDALVVVVSEERGTISIAHQGALEVVEPVEVKERLSDFLSGLEPTPPSQAVVRWLVREPELKLVALVLAVLLWFGLAYRIETVQRQFVAPIEYRGLPAGWAIEEPRPTQARITLSGPERDFDRFDPGNLIVSLNLSRPREAQLEFAVGDAHISGSENLTILDIEPRIVSVRTYRIATLSLPIRVPLRGEPQGGNVVDRVEIRPANIRVEAPAAWAEALTAIATEPVDVGRLEKTITVRLQLQLPARVRLVENQPAVVTATIHVAPQPSSQKAGVGP